MVSKNRLTPEKSASIVSLVLNPTVIAGFGFILLYPLRSIQISISPIGICITFGILIPLLMMHQLSKRGIISGFYVPRKEERVKPFAGAIVSYIAGSAALILVNAPTILTAFMLSYVGNTVLVMLITLRWKISVHAAGITGPTTGLIYGIGLWAAVLFTLLLPVGWARMRLRAHTPWEMLAGGLVTIAATWIQMTFYSSIL